MSSIVVVQFAAMKWLVLAVIILAQQAAKAPEGKGAAKSIVAQDAQQAKPAKRNDASAKPSAALSKMEGFFDWPHFATLPNLLLL
jgi:hypothetical protein